jgi:aminopeptidase N
MLLTVLAAVPCLAAPFSFDTTPGRLPKTVVPRAYRIAIVPDLAARRFEGRESVTLDVRAPVRTLELDSLNETLRDVRFDGKRVASVASDDAAQLTTIRLAHTAARGAHVLSFDYRGRIETEPRGLFVQRYVDVRGKSAEMLSTEFESIDARRMFPSWDEPAFRATFALTVTVPAAWATVGNMPVAARVVRGAVATTAFAPTPPMSTYLLEFTGGDLNAVRDRNGTPIGVWAQRGSAGEGAYALASARQILADYDTYFGIRYPLPKLDLIAIPGGYPGAMENWGAITFNDGLLLAGPGSTESDRQQIYGDYLSHEMAHLWTGDLVTTAWWTDIWLNESFANWRSASETDARHPEWHWWERQDADKEVAMEADALRSSHAIVQPSLDERMADAAFDGPITYSKGQAFLRMLEAYLTPERFRAGMQRYLRAHAYSNATSDDLWRALRAASGVDVARFSRGWTRQAGFPLVSARATCDAAGNRTVALSQRRFLTAGTDPDGARWDIPVHVRSGSDPDVLIVLHGGGATVAAGRCDAPLSANAGGVGFYRVAYDPATLAVDARAFATLPPADRIVLLDDQWALAANGFAPLASYLALVRGLGDERDQRVWEQSLDALSAFARGVAAPLAGRLGWDPRAGEPEADRALRPQVLAALGAWNDPATLAEARARFEHLRVEPGAFDTATREVIVRIVGRDADAATFDALVALAEGTRDPDRQLAFYDAVMRVRDPALAQRALRIALSRRIPAQLDDARLGFVLAVADAHPAAAWRFFCDHAATLLAPDASTAAETAAAELPRAFWRGVPLPEIAAWLDANEPTERSIGIPRGIERAEDQIARTPRLIAGADAYVAGAKSGTSARISSRSGIASRNAPTILGSNPKPASFSICSTAMLTDTASRHGRRDVSAENVSATATTRANNGIATPCSPAG